MRIGIAGYGRIAELVHYPIIRRRKDLELTAIYDVTPERLHQARSRGLAIYDDLDEFMAFAPVDIVLIAAPTKYHYPIAAKGLEYGKHLIIEKPIGLSADEAAKLRQMAEWAGRVVTVYHSRRFDPDYLFVQSVIGTGQLGNLRFVERSHHMDGAGVEFGVKSYDPRWRITEQLGGGVLLDWGIHLADQLLCLGLGNVRAIHGGAYRMNWHGGNADDYVNATLLFDNGRLATLRINSASGASCPTWIVGGDQGTLQIQKNEAYLFRKGHVEHMATLPNPSRFPGELIYETFLKEVNGTGRCAIQLDEAVQSMRWLDRILENTVTMGEAVT